jgi:hypothetical protein
VVGELAASSQPLRLRLHSRLRLRVDPHPQLRMHPHPQLRMHPHPRLQAHPLLSTTKRQAVLDRGRSPTTPTPEERWVRGSAHTQPYRSHAGSPVLQWRTVIRGGTLSRKARGTTSFTRQPTTSTTTARHPDLLTRFSWIPMCRSVEAGWIHAGQLVASDTVETRVVADADRLRQVLIHLLTKAVRRAN